MRKWTQKKRIEEIKELSLKLEKRYNEIKEEYKNDILELEGLKDKYTTKADTDLKMAKFVNLLYTCAHNQLDERFSEAIDKYTEHKKNLDFCLESLELEILIKK